ncbi:MAG: tetratricopeptide repeat protein, partial [Candidatus Nitrosocosmicus sp.]
MSGINKNHKTQLLNNGDDTNSNKSNSNFTDDSIDDTLIYRSPQGNKFNIEDSNLRKALNDITKLLSEKIFQSSIDRNHKDSIEKQLEELANLMSLLSVPTDSFEKTDEPKVSMSEKDSLSPVQASISVQESEKTEINPQYADAYNNKGLSLYYLGNNQEAIACYDKAIEINPEYDLAYYNKGIVLSVTGNNQEAIACYDKAIEINPQYADAYNNKGLSLYYLGNNQEAIACYDKAIEINPEYDLAYYNKGIVLSVTGNNQEAIACYDKAIEINPQYADAYNNKGLSLYYLGNNQEAIACYDKAIEINP